MDKAGAFVGSPEVVVLSVPPGNGFRYVGGILSRDIYHGLCNKAGVLSSFLNKVDWRELVQTRECSIDALEELWTDVLLNMRSHAGIPMEFIARVQSSDRKGDVDIAIPSQADGVVDVSCFRRRYSDAVLVDSCHHFECSRTQSRGRRRLRDLCGDALRQGMTRHFVRSQLEGDTSKLEGESKDEPRVRAMAWSLLFTLQTLILVADRVGSPNALGYAKVGMTSLEKRLFHAINTGVDDASLQLSHLCAVVEGENPSDSWSLALFKSYINSFAFVDRVS